MAKKLTYICLHLILLVSETIIRNWDKFELMREAVGWLQVTIWAKCAHSTLNTSPVILEQGQESYRWPGLHLTAWLRDLGANLSMLPHQTLCLPQGCICCQILWDLENRRKQILRNL